MNRQAGTPQDKFHYHKVQHLPGEENAAVRTDFFWGGPRDRALADSIIKPKEVASWDVPCSRAFLKACYTYLVSTARWGPELDILHPWLNLHSPTLPPSL